MFANKKIWSSLVLWFLFVPIIYAQSPQFKTFTNRQGLSTYNTRKIIQDNFGFLWIATQDGINRFDGTRFNVITKNTTAKITLGGTFITDCCIDDKGLIWLGSEYGGVDVINPADLSITKQVRQNEKDGLISNWVRAVCYNGSDEIWMGTYYGLSVLNKNTNNFTNLTLNYINKSEPLNISCISRDSSSNMWLGIENEGLVVLNRKKEVIAIFDKHYFEMHAGTPLKIFGFYVDKKGVVFACTNAGLKVFRPGNNTYTIDTTTAEYIPYRNMEVHTCLRDKQNNFWEIGRASCRERVSVLV